MTSEKPPFTVIDGDRGGQISATQTPPTQTPPTQMPTTQVPSSPEEGKDKVRNGPPGTPAGSAINSGGPRHTIPDRAPAPIAVNDEQVLRQIAQLEVDHRDLDIAIASTEERVPYDRLSLMRLKKKKLAIKDEITKLKNSIEPDIIA